MKPLGVSSITVVVCTYNRCQTLARALASIAASRMPSSVEWDVLVVDNNSSDGTREVVEHYRRQYPGRFGYLMERQQGLSRARNAGVRGSAGDIIVFTDDDVTVDPEWLRNLTKDLGMGEWAGSAGRIVPVLESPLPKWLAPDQANISGPFVALDLGPVPAPMTQAPFGANMAFQKAVFHKYGEFRTDLGRSGDGLLSCEDSEFGQRLLAAGERLRYEPSAVVNHPVPGDRLHKGYLLSWFFGKGQSDVRAVRISAPTGWTVAGIPPILFRRIVRWTAQWLVSVRPSERFGCRLNMWYIAGAISAYYQRSHVQSNESASSFSAVKRSGS